MRRPKRAPHHLVQPLNQVLATPASVRLMRALALSPVSLASGELVTRAQLGRTSIYPALRALERAGVIELVGAGAQRQVQLRERHPLSRPLKKLFRAEARRFEKLIAALRELLADVPRRALSAWVDESAADAQHEDTLALCLVAPPEELQELIDGLEKRLAKVEHAYDVHIAVNGRTPGEFEALAGRQGHTLAEVLLLDGLPPAALLEPPPPDATAPALESHEERDARFRRLALAVATKIARDPGLIDLAQHRIKRRARKASPAEKRELTEWRRVLSTMSPARLRRFLLSDSDQAIRLRQSLPAMNLLSPSEKDAVIRSQSDADVRAAVTRR